MWTSIFLSGYSSYLLGVKRNLKIAWKISAKPEKINTQKTQRPIHFCLLNSEVNVKTQESNRRPPALVYAQYALFYYCNHFPAIYTSSSSGPFHCSILHRTSSASYLHARWWLLSSEVKRNVFTFSPSHSNSYLLLIRICQKRNGNKMMKGLHLKQFSQLLKNLIIFFSCHSN